MQERLRVSQSIKEHLNKAQQRMTYFANQNRTERTLAVGDYVILKLQPYRQQSVAIRRSLKLAAKYYGLFEVLEKIGQVSYRLNLPEELRYTQFFMYPCSRKRLGQIRTLPPLYQNGTCKIIAYWN